MANSDQGEMFPLPSKRRRVDQEEYDPIRKRPKKLQDRTLTAGVDAYRKAQAAGGTPGVQPRASREIDCCWASPAEEAAAKATGTSVHQEASGLREGEAEDRR